MYNVISQCKLAAREMLALEISADPVLRNFIRRVYSTDSVITITPTSKGIAEIKPSHKYYASF
jgi:hypothetical protein